MGLLKRLHLIEDAEDYSEEMQFGRDTANIPEQPETDIAGSAVYEGEAGTDTLIEDIYAQNDLQDRTRSIYKVAELIDSLPKEMTTATKLSTVTTILNSFGLSILEVVTDGENRLEKLNGVKKMLTDEAEEKTNSMSEAVEVHKQKIEYLTSEIAKLGSQTKHSNEMIDKEAAYIKDIIGFIGGAQ